MRSSPSWAMRTLSAEASLDTCRERSPSAQSSGNAMRTSRVPAPGVAASPDDAALASRGPSGLALRWSSSLASDALSGRLAATVLPSSLGGAFNVEQSASPFSLRALKYSSVELPLVSGVSAPQPGNRTSTAVMLSPPRAFVARRSGERLWSRSPSRILAIFCGVSLLSSDGRSARMKSTTCWSVFTSQTPSQQTTRNSSSALRSKTETSGVPDMIWPSGPLLLLFLYSRSPSARDRFRFPFTRCWDPTVST
mmetsp:Transcript_1472/g.4295  ORF Transcript_1472/g.4295 Transcript_1472/m.4295 type:complete len:252 (+) Transcript_1472:299-1054(+)